MSQSQQAASAIRLNVSPLFLCLDNILQAFKYSGIKEKPTQNNKSSNRAQGVAQPRTRFKRLWRAGFAVCGCISFAFIPL
jgi:hypothetical protein